MQAGEWKEWRSRRQRCESVSLGTGRHGEGGGRGCNRASSPLSREPALLPHSARGRKGGLAMRRQKPERHSCQNTVKERQAFQHWRGYGNGPRLGPSTAVSQGHTERRKETSSHLPSQEAADGPAPPATCFLPGSPPPRCLC